MAKKKCNNHQVWTFVALGLIVGVALGMFSGNLTNSTQVTGQALKMDEGLMGIGKNMDLAKDVNDIIMQQGGVVEDEGAKVFLIVIKNGEKSIKELTSERQSTGIIQQAGPMLNNDDGIYIVVVFDDGSTAVFPVAE